MRPRTSLLAALGCVAACACTTTLLAADFRVTTPAEFQAALTTASGNGQSDRIEVAAGTYNLTATLVYVQPAGSGEGLDITGDNSGTVVLDGQNNVQIMSIDMTAGTQNTGVAVSRLTFRNGNAQAPGDTGGGLEIRLAPEGNASVTNAFFVDNRSADDGGGLYVRGGQQILVYNGRFEGNQTLTAGSDGGGAHLSGSGSTYVGVVGCEFIGNRAPDNGGGLQVEGLDPLDIVPNVGQIDFGLNLFEGNVTAQVESGEGGGADLAANEMLVLP